jgi:hypothetical protein
MYVTLVPLVSLYSIYKALGQTFFDRNIRGALSPDNTPNKKIREALEKIVFKKADPPSIFPFRHNGVTLAADRIVITPEADLVQLHVPRLLNGAQTVSSLGKFLDDNNENALLRENRAILDDVHVLVRLIEGDPSSGFITDITIANNQQNAVPPWALRAMDRLQVDFADKFRDEARIFYSRQAGAFKALSDSEREEMGIDDPKDIDIRALAQTFLALQGEVYNISHLPAVFEKERLYRETFKQAYLACNVRGIVVIYKLGLLLTREAIPHAIEHLAEKYSSAIPAARNLIWALLIQAALNDDAFDSYCDDYGTNLRRTQPFRELVRKLTRTRIAPILKNLFLVPSYREKINAERYDFLRSNETYKKAVELAERIFGWERRLLP